MLVEQGLNFSLKRLKFWSLSKMKGKLSHVMRLWCSFFPQTIRDWNSLTDTFLSAAERAEDSVAKFTSLVRARD